jgi:very-short-patch-repair endonuclease
MNSQAVSNLIWACATLGRMPRDETWAALETAAERVARDMNSQDVSNLIWACAKLGRMPEDKTWAALETAAERVARDMNSQNVSNLIWACAKLGRIPGDEMWTALETEVGRVAQDMHSQAVSNLIWAYARLGRTPAVTTLVALGTAAGRVARNLTSQALAGVLWAYAILHILRDVSYPSCHAALWDIVCSLKVQHFTQKDLLVLFHVHLMHHFSSSSGSVKVIYPAWLMVEARDAWMQQVRDDKTVSRSHQELASVIGELGIRHEVERVMADGYFSMDIYLPEYNIAVEFDGQSHYYHNTDASSSRDASMTRTAKTELRDLFLAKQCAKVVTVPWFEWRVLNTFEARRAYVKKKLAKEAGIDV